LVNIVNENDVVFFTKMEKRMRAFGQDPPAGKPRFPRKPPANDPPRRKPIKQRTKALPEPFIAPVDLSGVMQ
jgi:hypothetical protein